LLEVAVQVMRERLDRMRGVTRLHTPSTGEPLIVLIIDEIAALTGWITDRTMKRRIVSALGLILSQGRAAGVVVVGAVQDPRKDVLPQRDLFSTRIALRLNEADHVTLVLGPGARNRGAYCDLIPDTMQGVGYVMVRVVAAEGCPVGPFGDGVVGGPFGASDGLLGGGFVEQPFVGLSLHGVPPLRFGSTLSPPDRCQVVISSICTPTSGANTSITDQNSASSFSRATPSSQRSATSAAGSSANSLKPNSKRSTHWATPSEE
jgi:hypothetical protein